MKRAWLAGAIAAALLIPLNAKAEGFEAVPTNWRLQLYVGLSMVVWYTPAACNGRLDTQQLTQPERDVFWATIMTAKVANRSVGIEYEVVNSYCEVRSFYLQQP
jgi:hypothetical protein